MMDFSYGRAILLWPLAAASATILGSAVFALAMERRERGAITQICAALLPLWRVLAVVILTAVPMMLISIASEMAATSWRNALPLLISVVIQTHAGRVWGLLLPAALALVFYTFVSISNPLRARTLAILAATLILLEALSSHAIDHGYVAVAFYFIHEAAAGLWLGALLGLWICARSDPSPEWLSNAAFMVSRIAGWSVSAIVLSGTYTAYLGLGFDWYRLLFSSYGRTLMVKIVAFCIVLSIGAFNRARLVPALDHRHVRLSLLRNVGIESAILITAVFGLAAMLANTAPATGHTMYHSAVAVRSQADRLEPALHRSRIIE